MPRSLSSGQSCGPHRRAGPPARTPGAGEERIDDRLVLLRFARAGGVDQPAAGPNERRGAFEQRELSRRRDAGRSLFVPTPADVGIAPDRAKAGAGRIDQHAVEAGCERQRAGAGTDARSERSDAPLARTVSRSRRSRRGRTSQATRGPVAHVGGHRTVFPPGEAHRSSTRSPGCAPTPARRAATLRPGRRTIHPPRRRSGLPAVTTRPSGA